MKKVSTVVAAAGVTLATFALGSSPLGGCRATITIPPDRVRATLPVEMVGI